ncbi:MAG: DUF192 domain-containing protein [Rhodospirillaceae bacterium]|nr:DUF192 domain-containing protein [Rhodospirillaceae bacterium]
MTGSNRRFFVLGSIATAACASLAGAQPRVGPLPMAAVAIEAATGRHVFKVEIAQTEPERSQGLMFRQRLAADAGMLFDFGEEQPVAFWMQNTLIPLDMVFIRRDGRIANIAQRTIPLSTDAVPSSEPVRFVLEVNGGTTARLGIKAGDRVTLPPTQR